MTEASSFHAYVHQHAKVGVDCDARQASYITHDTLARYWTQSRVDEILRNKPWRMSHWAEVGELRKKRLRVFSILVYASSQGALLTDELLTLIAREIDDCRLPLDEQSQILSREAWAILDQFQWMFCPIQPESTSCSGHQHALDSRHVFTAIELSRRRLGIPEPLRIGPRDAIFRFLSMNKDNFVDREHTQASINYPACTGTNFTRVVWWS